jgi:plastocyanin
MRRRTFVKLGGTATLVTSSVLAGCSGSESTGGTNDSETDQSPGNNTTTTEGDSSDVEGLDRVSDKTYEIATESGYAQVFFNPIGVLIEPGATIKFVFNVPDNTTTAYEDRIPEDAEPWDSGLITETGGTFEKTFDVPGTYDYYSKPGKDEDMFGRIVVGKPGGPAENAPERLGNPFPPSSIIMQKGWLGYVLYKGLCC